MEVRDHRNIVCLRRSTMALISSSQAVSIRPSKLIKRIHRYCYAPWNEIADLLRHKGGARSNLETVCRGITKNIHVYKRSGTQAPFKKISLLHLCVAFNSEIHADFMLVPIRHTIPRL